MNPITNFVQRIVNGICNGVKGFLLALQFLTIIPIGTKKAVDKNRLSLCTVYFPIIGLVLGLILAGVNSLLALIPLEEFLTNVILLTLLIILTGGLHLDGLADTFDALSSRKNKSQMLEIMRDSSIGTMGVLSLICTILVKLSLLFPLGPEVKKASLISMCLLGRYALVFSMFIFSYAREEGKAKVFMEGMNLKIFSLATVISLLCSIILLRLAGLIIFIMVVIFTFLMGRFIANKIGGMTGDTLGAINELTEVFVLLNIFVLTKAWG